MNDPTADPAAEADGQELSEEISRMMGSVWQRHTGERPSSISTEIGTDKVKCVIVGDAAPEAADEADMQVAMLISVSDQRNAAIDFVRRATHRRVVGFISNRDDKAGTSTQTFILDRRVPRN
jgi:hypothetical protein